MSTMNVSLPPTLKEWVETQLEERGYGTASEYVRALIREDRERKTKEIDAWLSVGLPERPGKKRDALLRARLAKVRAEIDAGYKQAQEGKLIPGERAFATLRKQSKKLQARKA